MPVSITEKNKKNISKLQKTLQKFHEHAWKTKHRIKKVWSPNFFFFITFQPVTKNKKVNLKISKVASYVACF